MKIVACFNNTGGVGKTTLTYHLAWMFHHLGVRVLVADLDPQANLTVAFLAERTLDPLWQATPSKSVFGAIHPPPNERLEDVSPLPYVHDIDGIGLIPGDLALSGLEQRLAQAWSVCLDDNGENAKAALRVTTLLFRMIKSAAERQRSELVLLDVGPNLGALNRAALLAADAVIVPLAADLYSLRGLQTLGPALREWREGWKRRSVRFPGQDLALPPGTLDPVGYVVFQHAASKAHDPSRIYQRWTDRFPRAFHRELLNQEPPEGDDPYRLALVRHFRSLLPLSLEARKPVFDLKAADGAIGSHAVAAKDAYQTFEALAREIAGRCGVEID